MPRIRTGHFQADGDSYNLELGFVPNYLRLFNANATTGEVAVIEWFGNEMGDGKAFVTKIIADNGSTANVNIGYVSSGGMVSDFSTSTISTTNPVAVTGSLGVTIDTAFMDDNDEVWYLAIQSDRDVDHGDIA